MGKWVRTWPWPYAQWALLVLSQSADGWQANIEETKARNGSVIAITEDHNTELTENLDACNSQREHATLEVFQDGLGL